MAVITNEQCNQGNTQLGVMSVQDMDKRVAGFQAQRGPWPAAPDLSDVSQAQYFRACLQQATAAVARRHPAVDQPHPAVGETRPAGSWREGGGEVRPGPVSQKQSAAGRTVGQLQQGPAINHGQYDSNNKVERVTEVISVVPNGVNVLSKCAMINDVSVSSNHREMINDVSVLSNPNVCTQQKSNVHVMMGADFPQQVELDFCIFMV